MLLTITTYSMLSFAALITHDFCLLPWFGLNPKTLRLNVLGNILWVVYIVLLILSLTSHFRAMTADPGLVPKDLEISKKCKRCQSGKPARAHHCRICDRCVFRMDHHCPWVGNCVGYGNQKYFLLFLFYIGVLSAYTLALLSLAGIQWYYNGSRHDPIAVAGCAILTVLSLFFAIFVTSFISEQLESLRTNTTLVETYQFKKGKTQKGFWYNFAEIFGNNKLFWFLPINTMKPADFFEEVVAEKTEIAADSQRMDNGVPLEPVVRRK